MQEFSATKAVYKVRCKNYLVSHKLADGKGIIWVGSSQDLPSWPLKGASFFFLFLFGMVVQVTGDQLKQVLQEVRGRITPEEGRALVSRALRDRDQADSDKWQVKVQF